MVDDILEDVDMGTGARGCGKKRDGGLYACVGLSENGSPIEDFVIDPVMPWEAGPFQGGFLVDHTNSEGNAVTDFDGKPVTDLLMWVGAENYTSPADFVEEIRKMGLSKRLPSNFPIERLSPTHSRIILIHPNAIPQFGYTAAYPWGNPNVTGSDIRPYHPMCREESAYRYGQRSTRGGKVCEHPVKDHNCTFDLWALGAYQSSGKHKVTPIEEGCAEVKTPSVAYKVPTGITFKNGVDQSCLEFKAGAFLIMHITHFEFCSEAADPSEARKIAHGAGFAFRTVDEDGRPNNR